MQSMFICTDNFCCQKVLHPRQSQTSSVRWSQRRRCRPSTVELTFISEGCSNLITVLLILEGTSHPTVGSAYSIMEDLGSYLVNGTAKTCRYGAETDELLREMGLREEGGAWHSSWCIPRGLQNVLKALGHTSSQRGLQAGKGVWS